MARLVHVLTVPQSFVFLKGQVGYMKDRGLEAVVISSPGRLLEQFAREEKIGFRTVSMTRKISIVSDFQALWRLFGLFRRLKPCIVHGSTPKAGLLSMVAATLAGIPVRVYTARGLIFERFSGAKREFMKFWEALACFFAHRVIAISPSVAQALVREHLCSVQKVECIGLGSSNGLDATRFNPDLNTPSVLAAFRKKHAIPEGCKVIGFVGRIVRSKGVHELIEAWNILKREFASLHLLLVGSTERDDAVDDKILEQIKTDSRISFGGHIENVVNAYGVMDLLVLPTHREGFGNVIIEAAAMGLPVVAARVTGCIDAVEDGKTGILVPPRDAVALANAIKAYLHDEELRLNHGTAGRDRVLKYFRPVDIWDGVYQVYAALLQEKKILVEQTKPTDVTPRQQGLP